MKLMLVAGEASGDTLGAALLAELRQKEPQLTAMGVGGVKMRQEGLIAVADVNDLSVIGIVEVVRCLPRLIRVFRRLVQLLQQEKPDLLITIDLPDFNFMLARRAKAMGIQVVHYVSPQVWAWRSGRVHSIAASVDHLLALFPFETACYEGTGLAVDFVGHPLVEKTALPESRQVWRSRLGIGDHEKLVAVLPGSRHGEIRRLLAEMITACGLLAQDTSLRFILPLADTLKEEDLQPHWPHGEKVKIKILHGQTYGVLQAADAAMVASGTATLETALLGVPMVVAYRVNSWSYWIGRRVIQVPWISLVNIVAGRLLVPERIQQEANAQQLAADVRLLLQDPLLAQTMKEGFLEIRKKLSPPPLGAADIILRLIHKKI
ncbi:MAG: lipid-A-disaccharide synthase [Magnetococcales bacterium]|nr:lipid-A-disaccharide synthase [Magnetococcales bacterium]NGZ25674.1 lipid-A-disaccharide synthase [Magnetococcales bacterium]